MCSDLDSVLHVLLVLQYNYNIQLSHTHKIHVCNKYMANVHLVLDFHSFKVLCVSESL